MKFFAPSIGPPRKTTSFISVWLVTIIATAMPGVILTPAMAGETGRTFLPAVLQEQTLFRSGEDGYHTYRIPALLVTRQNTILAFIEARKNSPRDHGDIDLMLRRSFDGGRSWSQPQIVCDDGEHTMGNPCPVVDRATGTIWLPFSRDNQQMLVSKSDDDGQTWSEPLDITPTTTRPQWYWFGAGPGHGIQMESGRLVIPAWGDVVETLGQIEFSYTFYSDDHGSTWQHNAALDLDTSDECEVVQLVDGRLYMNARSRQGKGQRAYSFSQDRGHSWLPVQFDKRLPEPSCQGGLVRFTKQPQFQRNRILLSTPAHQGRRERLTVRLSYDECQSWPVSKVLYQKSSAYSDLAVTEDQHILTAYEADNHSRVVLARFNLEWLTNGQDHVQSKPGN